MTAPIAAIIEQDAATITSYMTSYFASLSGPAKQLHEAMAYGALNGGKRVRASLTLSAARLALAQQGQTVDEASLQPAIIAAAALEFIHAYSLIHDDLPAMDDADTRRGKPSAHIAFDEATAILAGDALQTEAFLLLTNDALPVAVSHQLIRLLASASGAAGMAGGQMRDLQADEAARQGKPFTAAETEEMQAMKTGALIAAAPVMGAVSVGGEAGLQDDLYQFAAPLGLAFQIADDLLDVTQDGAALGKPAGRDKDQGKASFVDFYGLDGAQEFAERLMNDSLSALAPYGNGADELHQIAHFVINRSH